MATSGRSVFEIAGGKWREDFRMQAPAMEPAAIGGFGKPSKNEPA
jgi:hypothetical protein